MAFRAPPAFAEEGRRGAARGALPDAADATVGGKHYNGCQGGLQGTVEVGKALNVQHVHLSRAHQNQQPTTNNEHSGGSPDTSTLAQYVPRQ